MQCSLEGWMTWHCTPYMLHLRFKGFLTEQGFFVIECVTDCLPFECDGIPVNTEHMPGPLIPPSPSSRGAALFHSQPNELVRVWVTDIQKPGAQKHLDDPGNLCYTLLMCCVLQPIFRARSKNGFSENNSTAGGAWVELEMGQSPKISSPYLRINISGFGPIFLMPTWDRSIGQTPLPTHRPWTERKVWDHHDNQGCSQRIVNIYWLLWMKLHSQHVCVTCFLDMCFFDINSCVRMTRLQFGAQVADVLTKSNQDTIP